VTGECWWHSPAWIERFLSSPAPINILQYLAFRRFVTCSVRALSCLSDFSRSSHTSSNLRQPSTTHHHRLHIELVVPDSEHTYYPSIHILYNILYIIEFVFISRIRIWWWQIYLSNVLAPMASACACAPLGNPELASRKSKTNHVICWSPLACAPSLGSLRWCILMSSSPPTHRAHRLWQQALMLPRSPYFI